MIEERAPFVWFQTALNSLEWPVVVTAAFFLGRYVQSIEHRLTKAESRLTALVDRHMPAIHRALAEILGALRIDK